MKKTKSVQAVNLNKAFEGGADMSAKEEEILAGIIKDTGFAPEKVIWRSSYWGTNQIGAVHYLGSFEGRPAVLKIQGVKPEVSEIYMIEQFAAQNRSKVIRPPRLFKTIPWNDESGFEAIIMEHVTGKQVLESKRLQTREGLKKFFTTYLEYRGNCLPEKPWLPKSNKSNPVDDIRQLLVTSKKAYPEHPFRQTGDEELALQAAEVLSKALRGVDLEFVHGHISTYDLVYQGDEIVLFSNLFWKWKYPFYDVVLAYHWFIFELEHVSGITPEQIDEQRKLWQEEFFALPLVKASEKNSWLVKAALLDRAISGFILDSFLVDKSRPIAKYLTDSTREQVKKWIGELL